MPLFLQLALFLLGTSTAPVARRAVKSTWRSLFAAIAAISLLGLEIGALACWISATEAPPDDAGSRSVGWLLWQFLQGSLPAVGFLWMLGYATRYATRLRWTPAGLCLLLLTGGTVGLLFGSFRFHHLAGKAVAFGVLSVLPAAFWTWLMRKA